MISSPPRRLTATLGCVALLATLLPTTACKPGKNLAGQIAKPPSAADATGQAKCGVNTSANKPLIIEWPGAERAALEARAARGLVPVRYSGCEMEILTACSVLGLKYDYLGLTPRSESVTIRDFDELYANLPIGAAKLEARLERAGQLNVDMMISGRLEAPPRPEYTEDLLEGVLAQCQTATHIVTGITVGAFQFTSGASAEIGGGAEVTGVAGGGARSGSQKEYLSDGGDFAACENSQPGSTVAPPRCNEMLRVEVIKINRRTAGASPSSSGGTQTGLLPPSNTDTGPVVWDLKKERRLKLWTAAGYTGAAGFLVSALGIYGGIILRSNANKDLAELQTNNGGTLPTNNSGRDAAVRKYAAGNGIFVASLVGVVVFGAAWLVGLPTATKLKRQKQSAQAAISPTGLRVRF